MARREEGTSAQVAISGGCLIVAQLANCCVWILRAVDRFTIILTNNGFQTSERTTTAWCDLWLQVC
jgi:hypothetical protein